MSSLTAGLGGGDGGYAPLECLPAARLVEARHVVLLVIDGLGDNFLRARGGGHLYSRRLGAMSSVAPPTTAAAIPVFLTAAAPVQHGFTGWFQWFRELGCVTAVLPFVGRGSRLPLGHGAGPGPRELAGAGPVFERLPVSSHVVTPRYIAHSVFSHAFSAGARIHAYDDLDGLFAGVRSLLSGGRKRRYVYAYWPELDALAHEHGIASARVAEHFEQLDAAFGRFLTSIAGSDTVVLVTADHGFVDVPPERQIQLQAHPELECCLTLPLCGEPRMAYCYVRADAVGRFDDYVRSQLDHALQCVPAGQLLEQGLFGPGTPHPALAGRIGDRVLLLRDGWLIKDWMPGEAPYHHVGVHGGLSADELYVPLVYAEA